MKDTVLDTMLKFYKDHKCRIPTRGTCYCEMLEEEIIERVARLVKQQGLTAKILSKL